MSFFVPRHPVLLLLGFFAALTGTAEAHHRAVSSDVPGWNLYLCFAVGGLLAIEVVFIAVSRRRGDGRLERLWTLAPLTVIVALGVAHAVPSWRNSYELSAAGADTLRIEVTARQWQWDYRYTAENFGCGSEIHVPAGHDVQLTLISRDVLHSFDVPRLGLHCDVVPGTSSSLAFRVDRPGRYEVYCGALCGSPSQEMSGVIAVDRRVEYATWEAAHRKE